jgi:hypothetical protein
MNEDPSFEGRQQMMEIEIKFGKGKVDYVVVHYGDDPVMLAKVCACFLSCILSKCISVFVELCP